MSDITSFLDCSGTDHRGRRIDEILSFEDEHLEAVHDYIQWLFPLPERSAFNPYAPSLSIQDIEAIKQSTVAKRNLEDAALRMLAFYQHNTHWLTAINHNHLRISRIIHSLSLILGPDEAKKFHDEIMHLVESAGHPVSSQALDHWRRATQTALLK